VTTPRDVNLQAIVSACLTGQGLGFVTYPLDDSARMWRFELTIADSADPVSLTILITTGGSLFSVSTAIEIAEGGWQREVRDFMESTDLPFVRAVPYRDQNNQLHESMFWLKAEVPMDLDAPDPIVPGAIYQAIAAVNMCGRKLFDDFPGRFKPAAPKWVPVSFSSVPPGGAFGPAAGVDASAPEKAST
jgi:hypothetical protein